MAVARHPRIDPIIAYDERGAAFLALGHARFTGRPAVLICTSGSAAANYLPAVVEASQDDQPMIILSADRPPELRDIGANQTIVQVGLYGGYVRWQHELPCPDADVDPSVPLTAAGRAAAIAMGERPGPVHLNLPFREPLAPLAQDHPAVLPERFNGWWSGTRPWLERAAGRQEGFPVLDSSGADLSRSRVGLILAGRLNGPAEAAAVLDLAEHTGWPVWADITSGLRLHDHPAIIHHADLLLLAERFRAALRPDAVIQVGGRIVSKRIPSALAAAAPETWVHLAATETPQAGHGHVRCHLTGDVAAGIRALTTVLPRREATAWLTDMTGLNRRVMEVLGDAVRAETLPRDCSVLAWLDDVQSPEQWCP